MYNAYVIYLVTVISFEGLCNKNSPLLLVCFCKDAEEFEQLLQILEMLVNLDSHISCEQDAVHVRNEENLI